MPHPFIPSSSLPLPLARAAEAKEAMAEAQREYGASFEQPAEDVAPAAEPVAAAE